MADQQAQWTWPALCVKLHADLALAAKKLLELLELLLELLHLRAASSCSNCSAVMAVAASIIMSWVMRGPNAFHDRQPIGGVRAWPFHPGANGAAASAARRLDIIITERILFLYNDSTNTVKKPREPPTKLPSMFLRVQQY